ncbi:MAG: hypothetical protein QNJ44_23925 [Rhodobacter sp.]|nr:hypothetical protein [Rhodobacter sp.]
MTYSRLLALAPGFLVAALGFVSAAAGSASTHDFYEHECGQYACAEIYQGEGIDHPQIVVTLYRKGSGTGRTYITFVYDYPPYQQPSYSLYIDSHLAQRIGGPYDVPLSQGDYLELLDNAVTLIDGVEVAFNSASTASLGAWPSNVELEAIIQEAASRVPNSFREWDKQNGYEFEVPDVPDVPGQSVVAGLAGTQFVSNPKCQDPDNIDPRCGGINFPQVRPSIPPQQAIISENLAGPSDNLAGPNDRTLLRRHKALIRRAITRDLERAAARPSVLTSPRQTTQQGQMCSKDALYAEQSEDLCKERCNLCKEQMEAESLANASLVCTGLVGVGAAIISIETGGAALVTVQAIIAEGSAVGSCTALATSVEASRIISLQAQCISFCGYIWGEGGTGGASPD